MQRKQTNTKGKKNKTTTPNRKQKSKGGNEKKKKKKNGELRPRDSTVEDRRTYLKIDVRT